MKKLFLYSILFIFNGFFAQESKTITVSWNGKNKIDFQTYFINCPQFQNKNFSFDFERFMPVFTEKFNTNSTVNTSNFSIKNLVTQNISPSELGEINTQNLKENIDIKIQNFKERENSFYSISFVPILKINGNFQKIISFNLEIPYAPENRIKSNLTIQNSVLASGDFYRFYVQKSGIYKLSKQFLRDLGFNVNVDPRKIKIYGNGGKMIPHQNNSNYPIDLTENAIRFIGEEDGNFNDNDFIIFYAEGIDNWVEESKTNLNLYTDKAYYYVSFDGNNGKRIVENEQPTGTSNITINTFQDHQFAEEDEVNISKMGRKWFSKSFNIQNKKNYTFSFPNIVSGSTITIDAQAAANSSIATNFKLKVNNADVGTINLSSTTELHTEGNFQSNFPASAQVSLDVEYSNGGVPSSNGYLNYINLVAQRNLTGYGKQFRFQNAATLNNTGIAEFQVNQAQSISQIWDITNIYNVSAISNNNSSNINFKTNIGVLKKYIALDFNDLYTPLKETNARIGNQNLKGSIFLNQNNTFEDIDYLIITPAFLFGEANRLANFHRNHYQHRTKVVLLENIYPEFSSGQQDIGAIRNFIKYVYDNASNNANRLKYVNLFGDASFDPKNRILNNTNIVPGYQSFISNSLAGSFIADDFFGCMDNSEGDMDNSNFGIDIAVGRMIVSNTNQAREMVDKIINYHDYQSFGRWRNNIVMVADDADKTSDASLQVELDDVAVELYTEKPFLNINKIYLDSYNQVSSSGGQRYPNARKDLFEAFERGALVINYLGHGGENGLTGERVFETSDAQTFNNPFKYTCFITLTCEFSRFDNPLQPTAGEYTYWNPTGGAVAMITTTRQIGQLTAENINPVLNSKLFAYQSNTYPTIGEALRLAKNGNTNSASSLKVISLIGDPAMKLAIPLPKIVLTKINDVDVAISNTVFNALSSIKINGEVRDETGNTLLSNYNGEIAVQIYDKDLQRFALNNDGNSAGFQFTTLGNVIFRGNATVVNGKFELTFIVPKDIKIPVGNGRISFYAKSNNPTLKNQTGYSNAILVGGINENAPTDNLPPRVKLYMNDTNFVNGGITNESPIFLAFLEDENGINTASGIGHDIVAILDGDETKPFILNDFYETELNDYTKGKVRYPFRNLSVGLHTIKFTAWDVYNNPITAEIQFIVMGDETVTLTNVLNYPNPFVNYTQFWFSHNRPFESLEVQVQILTITGKLVKTINQTVMTDGFLSREISWDGKDDFGDRIGKGVYIYKLTVKSNVTNSKTEKIEKLVIL